MHAQTSHVDLKATANLMIALFIIGLVLICGCGKSPQADSKNPSQPSTPIKETEDTKQEVATKLQADQLPQQPRQGEVFWSCPEEVTFGVAAEPSYRIIEVEKGQKSLFSDYYPAPETRERSDYCPAPYEAGIVLRPFEEPKWAEQNSPGVRAVMGPVDGPAVGLSPTTNSYKGGTGYLLSPGREPLTLRTDAGPVARLNWQIRSGQNAYSKAGRTPQGCVLWIRKFASGSMQRGIAQWATPLEEGAKAGTIDVALPSRARDGDEVVGISMICFIETEQEGRSNLLELWFMKVNEGRDFATATKSASWFSSKSAGLDAPGANQFAPRP